MNLQDMLYIARSELKDLSMKKWSEAELVSYANMGKNQLVNIIRQAREDYFLTSTTSTVATAVAPNPSELTLPTDFLEAKDIKAVDTGYTDLDFIHCDQAKLIFRHALLDGASIGNGTGTILYDIYGNSTMVFAPGFDVALNIQVYYIKSIADMALPADTLADIPAYLHNYIPNFIACKALMAMQDPRFLVFKAALGEEEDTIRSEVQPRQIREPQFVQGFMEDEDFY